jgi:IPT/TIG domain
MKTKVILLLSIIIFIFFSSHSFGRTTIQINQAKVVNDILTLKGNNFDVGPVEVRIGGDLIECTVPDSQTIECSLNGLPAQSGGTWNVNITAGNSPRMNDEIDVYIPTGASTQCFPGDFVECYTDDPATIGVGQCVSGSRSCLQDGSWGDCQGQITPEDESCDDVDNDCDGDVDEGAGCDGQPCDDGNTCTENDQYIGGQCIGTIL